MAFVQSNSVSLSWQPVAIPAVCALIIFLGYGSQYLFNTAAELAPGPLTAVESRIFNLALLCLWWTYYKACTVDAGRLIFPTPTTKPGDDGAAKGETKSAATGQRSESRSAGPNTSRRRQRIRRCHKCPNSPPKPPRAHHCRHCKRCIPKMDHHCPWTANCVSHTTFPYFLRFLVFTNISLWIQLRLVYIRFAALWAERHKPSYLGPSVSSLVALTLLGLVGGFTAFLLLVMLVTTVKGWVKNETMVEGAERETHEAEVERSRRQRGEGWWIDADEDSRRSAGGRIKEVEFPYDIGFFANMAQAMGTRNVFLWFWPLAGGPGIPVPDYDYETGAAAPGAGMPWEWPENGFNAREGMWPPRRLGEEEDRVWRRRRRRRRQQENMDLKADASGTRDAESTQAHGAELRTRVHRYPEQGRVLGEVGDDEEDEVYNSGSYDMLGDEGGGDGAKDASSDFSDDDDDEDDDEGSYLTSSESDSGREDDNNNKRRRPENPFDAEAILVPSFRSWWRASPGTGGVASRRTEESHREDDEEDDYDDFDEEEGGGRDGTLAEKKQSSISAVAPVDGGGDFEDEDVPLGELLLRRRRAAAGAAATRDSINEL